jgi:translocation and assembly module TamA
LKASSKIRAAATALAMVCAAAFAQEPGPKYRMSVDAPTKELREMLSKGLQLSRWVEDPEMTPELLRRLAEEAVAEAREALAAQGYYSALVSYSIDRDRTPWQVVLHVVPGEQTKVSAVEISFSGPGAQDPEAADLLRQVRREWLLRPGMPFTQDAWNEAKRDATRKLSAWRYAAARLASSRARVDPKTQSAMLEVTLDSGPPFVFGALEVRGPKRYREQVVSNFSPVRPGQTYDRQLLELYTRRLLATGYFASARAELALEARDAAGAAPVRVSVIEGNSQNFEGGVSYNTDAGPRLELSHRNVDLFGTAWRGKSQLRLDQLTQEVRYDLESSPRPGATWWSGFGAAKRSIVQNEDNEEVSFGAAHNWAGRGSPTAVLFSAHAEEQRVQGQPNDHRHAVYFGFRIGFLDTDDIVLPRRGYFGQVNLGGAPDALSTRGFQRAHARGTILYSLGRNDDLQLRAEGGLVVARSREGIPSTFLFRTGGDQTIRGYDFESLGVRQGAAVLGGRYLALGSIEYTHWFSPVWGLAAFADAGNAWDTDSFDPVLGVGIGARFRTPIGPVRVDVAYGEEESSWRLHFSVGFVF